MNVVLTTQVVAQYQLIHCLLLYLRCEMRSWIELLAQNFCVLFSQNIRSGWPGFCSDSPLPLPQRCSQAQWALRDLAMRTMLTRDNAPSDALDSNHARRMHAVRFEAQVFVNTVQSFIASQLLAVKLSDARIKAGVCGIIE